MEVSVGVEVDVEVRVGVEVRVAVRVVVAVGVGVLNIKHGSSRMSMVSSAKFDTYIFS